MPELPENDANRLVRIIYHGATEITEKARKAILLRQERRHIRRAPETHCGGLPFVIFNVTSFLRVLCVSVVNIFMNNAG